MKFSAFLFFLFTSLASNSALALEMLSVSPQRTQPGQVIRVTGGPFEGNVRIYIGDQTVQPLSIQEREILFKVPDLSEGEYLLFLRSDEEDSRAFRLEVEEKPPVIYLLIPSVVDECTTDTLSRYEVQGDNFQRGAILLLDGTVVPSVRQNAQTLTLTPPYLKGGIHQVQAVNPSGRKSLPQALLVNNQPEIFSVFQGDDNVNSYELYIQGKNFFSNSKLLVDGRPIRTVSGIPAQTEIVRYVDCNTLVYIRYPYSRELKQVSLRVVNPNGTQTPPFSVTIP